MYTPKVGDVVLFGRAKGQKTRGTVVKVNRTKAKVRQDEERGLQKSHKVGTEWTVPFSLMEPIDTNRLSVSQQRNLAVNTLKMVKSFLETLDQTESKAYKHTIAAIKECE